MEKGVTIICCLIVSYNQKFKYMGLNSDEIMNYMKYRTLNTNTKYQKIQIENMFT